MKEFSPKNSIHAMISREIDEERSEIGNRNVRRRIDCDFRPPGMRFVRYKSIKQRNYWEIKIISRIGKFDLKSSIIVTLDM